MTKKQLIKALTLNVSIVIIDILLLSEGFLHLLSHDAIILRAIGISAMVMSALFFAYGNYCILLKTQPTKLYKLTEFTNREDYINALRNCPNQKIFKLEIDKSMKQIERMHKKSELLHVILLQYFTEGEMAYNRFQNVMKGTETIFFENIKRMINHISIFDPERFQVGQKQGDSDNSDYDDSSQQYVERIRTSISRNDILIRKLDDLILEISKLDDMKESSLGELPAIQEIDRLIEETKYYQ